MHYVSSYCKAGLGLGRTLHSVHLEVTQARPRRGHFAHSWGKLLRCFWIQSIQRFDRPMWAMLVEACTFIWDAASWSLLNQHQTFSKLVRFSEINYRMLWVYDGVCVCVWLHLCCFSVFLCFSHSQTLRPSKWSDGIISWQSWPWTNESILKKVTLACQEVRHRRMQMPWASYADFTSNGAQWSHQSNHCSPFCPYFVHQCPCKAAGCGLHKIIKCTNRDIWFVTVAIVTATLWGIKAWEPALAHPVTQASCIVCTENTKMRSSRFHHVFCDFTLHSQNIDTVKWHQYVLKFGFTSTLHCKDQIIRFGGDTDPSLPWPENHNANDQSSSMEKLLGEVLADHRSWEVFTSGLDWIWLNDHEMMIWFDCN